MLPSLEAWHSERKNAVLYFNLYLYFELIVVVPRHEEEA